MSLADEPPLRDLPDRAIRQSLQHPEHLRAFLEQVVPTLASRFGYDRARLAERLFPLEDWREREADPPFEIPFRLAGDEEIWALVLVLIEHQSATERLMPLRLLLYAALYWDRQWQQWRRLPEPRPTLRLHPVLPVVLYTGSRPWGSTRTLLELLGEPAEFHAFAPHWEPLIWSLADRSPEALLAASSEWLKALAVFRAEEAEAQTFLEVFARAVKDIAPLAAADPVRWNDLMRMLLTWAYWRRPAAERQPLEAAAEVGQADERRREEIRAMTNQLGPTLVELSLAKGRAEGRAEGIAEGRAEGMAEGRAEGMAEGRAEGMAEGRAEGMAEGRAEGRLLTAQELLRALVQQRFGAVPENLMRRIAATDDLARLEAAILQVWRVPMPEDLPL